MFHAHEAVSYMVREIAHICRTFPARAPGSQSEKDAAAYLADVLVRDCGSNDVKVETFKEHPSAFYGYFYFSAAFDTLCAVTFFVTPWLSLLFGSLALLLFLFQFVLYKQVIDPLFPERESVNITAIRPCEGVCKQRVFLNGHIDAAWEFPLNYRFGGIVFEIPGAMAVVGVLFYMVLAICQLSSAGAWVRSAALWALLFIPFFLLVGITYDPRRVVDGANDDLSGCFMGIALLRAVEKQDLRFQGTEIGVILTGSEEAGLRGAKAWCKDHADAYQDVPTYIISFDTIHDPRFLMVNTRDLNGTVAADHELCAAFLQAAKDVGVPCRKGWVPPMGGATDAAAFCQGGFRAIGITGLNHRLEDYYHTRKDSWDNLNEEGLENCFNATVRFVEILDQMHSIPTP